MIIINRLYLIVILLYSTKIAIKSEIAQMLKEPHDIILNTCEIRFFQVCLRLLQKV